MKASLVSASALAPLPAMTVAVTAPVVELCPDEGSIRWCAGPAAVSNRRFSRLEVATVLRVTLMVAFAGAWYFVAGFAILMLASDSHALSPWTMGLPFVIGQLLMAAVLHFASGEIDVED